MTFNIDPDALTRTGRAYADQAATLRGARERLGRIRWLSNRLRANGTHLQAFAQEAADVRFLFTPQLMRPADRDAPCGFEGVLS